MGSALVINFVCQELNKAASVSLGTSHALATYLLPIQK